MKPRKKLIEVALPLMAINKACAREKSIRHGHPSTLHLWWARRPLAAARAVIFGQMVDDPSAYVDALLADSKLRRKAESTFRTRKKRWEAAVALADKARSAGIEAPPPPEEPKLEDVAAEQERDRLFRILDQLVLWENTDNEEILQIARDEIWKSWRRDCTANAGSARVKELFDRNRLPTFHDPFSGGGAIPLEAQRLGLQTTATDLNPVSVIINRAMIEIPPRFSGKNPVNPSVGAEQTLIARDWTGAQGLAEDVRYYGRWMRDEAEKKIGRLYPKIEITEELVKERSDLRPLLGQQLTVIAWLWARTVRSPNPAFADVEVPLVSTFMLAAKPGGEAYVEPVVNHREYRFTVRTGTPKDKVQTMNGTKLARGSNFRCILSGAPISGDYIKSEGKAGRLGARLMAIVAEGSKGRIYLPPTSAHEQIASKAKPGWKPEGSVPARLTGGTCVPYGLDTWDKLYTSRQLVALSTFADLVSLAREKVRGDAVASVTSPGFLDQI